MASIAIDSADIRPSRADEPSQAAVTEPARRGRTFLAVGLAGGLAVIAVAGCWAAYGHLPAFPRLGGLASIVEPPRPPRTDIRIGAFPAMPDIRDGVPALVEPRPVRVVGPASPAAAAPMAVAQPTVDASTAPSPARAGGIAPVRGASLLSPSLSAPAAMAAVEPVRRIDGPSGSGLLPATPAGPVVPAVVPAERRPEPQAVAPATAAPPVRVAPAEPAVARAVPPTLPVETVVRSETAGLRAEPAETAALAPVTSRVATVPPAASQSAVPLPPPAPQRLVRAPETERSAAPVRTVARPRTATPPDTIAVAAAPATPATDEAADDRFEVLGMKLPNGRDIGNALSALGDSVKNLPKSF